MALLHSLNWKMPLECFAVRKTWFIKRQPVLLQSRLMFEVNGSTRLLDRSESELERENTCNHQLHSTSTVRNQFRSLKIKYHRHLSNEPGVRSSMYIQYDLILLPAPDAQAQSPV